jgi:hypothetical protein
VSDLLKFSQHRRHVALPLRAIVTKDVVVGNFAISAHSSLCLRVAAFTSKTTTKQGYITRSKSLAIVLTSP